MLMHVKNAANKFNKWWFFLNGLFLRFFSLSTSGVSMLLRHVTLTCNESSYDAHKWAKHSLSRLSHEVGRKYAKFGSNWPLKEAIGDFSPSACFQNVRDQKVTAVFEWFKWAGRHHRSERKMLPCWKYRSEKIRLHLRRYTVHLDWACTVYRR